MRKRSNCARTVTDMLAGVCLVSAGGRNNGAACEVVAFIGAESCTQAGPHHRVSEKSQAHGCGQVLVCTVSTHEEKIMLPFVPDYNEDGFITTVFQI